VVMDMVDGLAVCGGGLLGVVFMAFICVEVVPTYPGSVRVPWALRGRAVTGREMVGVPNAGMWGM